VAPKQDRGSSLVCGELTDATVAKSIAKSTSESFEAAASHYVGSAQKRCGLVIFRLQQRTFGYCCLGISF
jgi:hypothetical protein